MDDERVSREVFSGLALRVAERFCQGFNACVLAYGQTGSGKVRGAVACCCGRGGGGSMGGSAARQRADTRAPTLGGRWHRPQPCTSPCPVLHPQTYTMGTSAWSGASGTPQGIIPRLMTSLFGYVKAAGIK